MPKIVTKIEIDAPIERAFDLSRSIDFHEHSQLHRKEKAVNGIKSGLIDLNESVEWEAVHFFIKQNLTAKITILKKPFHFRDSMVDGAFKRFDHDHYFEKNSHNIKMTDEFDYDVPFGIIGKLFDKFILRKYMTKFFEERNLILKQTLESDSWKNFL